MSETPLPPDQRRLDRRSGSSQDQSQGQSQSSSQGHDDKLQIRVVPYSPPRVGSDASSSRPVSYVDSPPVQDNVEIHYRDTPEPGFHHGPGHVSRLRRLSGPHATPGQDIDSASDARTLPDEGRHASAPSPLLSPSPSPSLSPSPSPAFAPSRTPSPYRRARKIITIHADKTFSLVPTAVSASSGSDSLRSPQPSLTTSGSSYGRLSSGTFADDRPITPLTPLAERSLSPELPDLAPVPLPGLSDPSASGSPWNYRLVGGLRKVAKTPKSKEKQRASLPAATDADEPLPPLPETPPPILVAVPAARLATKPSFQSSDTDSTLSDRTNYKVYGQSSPVAVAAVSVAGGSVGADMDSLPPLSSHSNYDLLGESSSSNQSLYEQPRPQTGESDANYVLHGGPSASASSLVTTKSRVRSEFSRESLIVAPLRPIKRRSVESFGISKSRSRDSLRTASLTSISNIISQEATRALFVGPATIHLPPGTQRQYSWGGSSSGQTPMVGSQAHQWSSQLSTVASESEPGSEPPSRSLSPLTVSGRRSSGFNSFHSRQMLSISSSFGNPEEATSSGQSHSRSGSLDRPLPVLSRGNTRDPSGNLRQVRHHDEDGDGLADLEQLHHRSSRTRLASLMSSHSSDRNLRSSSSSRANSLTYSSLPAWARVYYGSGERRFLIAQPSSESMVSLYNDSRPGSSFLNRSPSIERFGTIFSPRRRPRDVSDARERSQSRRPESGTGSMDITPHPVLRVARRMKKQTSSIWSPHLQHDRRTSRYSIWEPPSAVWSAESGLMGRRNLQVVLFIAGFVLPFAWMVAALLPLPPHQQLDMVERLQSTSHIDLQLEASRQAYRVDETRYNSARWWRNLNRGMSIVGLLVIAAAIALIVVGVRQKWGS